MLEKAALIYSERKQSVDVLNHGWESGRWKLFHVIEIFQIIIFMMPKYEYIFVKSHWIVYLQIGHFTLLFIIFLE